MDVFLDKVPVFPPKRDIDFNTINRVLVVAVVTKRPYRMNTKAGRTKDEATRHAGKKVYSTKCVSLGSVNVI